MIRLGKRDTSAITVRLSLTPLTLVEHVWGVEGTKKQGVLKHIKMEKSGK